MVLYRKYRPQSLAELVGQENIKSILQNTFSKGSLSHAYLFAGPRGTGKTSTARILAKILNCEKNSPEQYGEPCNKCASCRAVSDGSHIDLIEIDAASNRGIDEIRELREKIKLAPGGSRFKIYIIDEVHMLTHEAFNALLKTLEEPPSHAVFILATTEPQKIPETVISRTTRFDFKTPTLSEIKEKLSFISKKEGWKFSEEILDEIAALSKGAFRDAEVLLEKIATSDIKADLGKVRSILGKNSNAELFKLVELLIGNDTRGSIVWLDQQIQSGSSVRVLMENILETFRRILLVRAGAEEVLPSLTEGDLIKLKELAEKLSKEQILKLTDLFSQALVDLREATIPSLPFEVAVVEATLGDQELSIGPQVKSVEEKETGTQVPKEVVKKEPEVLKKEVVPQALASKKSLPEEEKLFKEIIKKWGSVLETARQENSSLAIFLRSARPIRVDEDLVILEFGYSFHLEKVEEKKYRELLESILLKVLGFALRIKGIQSDKVPEPLPRAKKEEPVEEVDPASIFGKLE